MRIWLSGLLLLTLAGAAFAQTQRDDPKLRQLWEAAQKFTPKDGNTQASLASFLEQVKTCRTYVESVLPKDGLRTPKDFYLAAKIYMAGMPYFEDNRVSYELCLTSAILGDAEARAELPKMWDWPQYTMGFGQRLGTVIGGEDTRLKMAAVLPPDFIRDKLLSLQSSVTPSTAKSNDEIATLCDEDQKDRQSLDPATFKDVRVRDRQRKARVLELLKGGAPITGDDFAKCGLILQHGEVVEDFTLAHECGVIATVLGSRMGPSLCSVTYDRMLLNAGHRQRFGTQLGPLEKWTDKSNESPKERATLMAPGSF